jgi:hypothetical protein
MLCHNIWMHTSIHPQWIRSLFLFSKVVFEFPFTLWWPNAVYFKRIQISHKLVIASNPMSHSQTSKTSSPH